MVAQRVLLIAAAAILALVVLSCGDDGGPSGNGSATPTVQPSATPAITPATGVTTSPNGPNENGSAPVFWRTTDNFESVVAGEVYLVNFRITSGYDEPSLSVAATCIDCQAADVTFVGTNSPPVGQDAPGSYYPISFTFPEPGRWELTVQAGDDEMVIPVEVKAAS